MENDPFTSMIHLSRLVKNPQQFLLFLSTIGKLAHNYKNPYGTLW